MSLLHLQHLCPSQLQDNGKGVADQEDARLVCAIAWQTIITVAGAQLSMQLKRIFHPLPFMSSLDFEQGSAQSGPSLAPPLQGSVVLRFLLQGCVHC